VLVPENAGPGLIFVGVFPDLICEGTPVRCAVLPGPGTFVLEAVPFGAWWLLAYLRPQSDGGRGDPLLGHEPRWRGVHPRVQVLQGTPTERVTLRLRERLLLDPPILGAPFDLTGNAPGAPVISDEAGAPALPDQPAAGCGSSCRNRPPANSRPSPAGRTSAESTSPSTMV
jgi:hypothetical protein